MIVFCFTLACFVFACAALAVGRLRGRPVCKHDCADCPAHPTRTEGNSPC